MATANRLILAQLQLEVVARAILNTAADRLRVTQHDLGRR